VEKIDVPSIGELLQRFVRELPDQVSL
jgi:hypothetical protein